MLAMLKPIALISAAAILLTACTSVPDGPTVQVLPSPGKPLQLFQQEQAQCKDYAANEVSHSSQSANNMQVLTGVLGTVLGAGLGAAIGGGRGAAIGAGAGALGGTIAGVVPVGTNNDSIQTRYDQSFEQCMVTYGELLRGRQAWR
jgi:uncharacterized protein YcfJ